MKNEAVVHQLDVKVGTRTNVWVDRWEAYFNTEEEGHDGFVVYVADKSGWDNLYLYGWAGAGDVTPAWPGIAVKGTEVINGVTYKYFDMGKALDGYEGVNLIFNNNDGKQFDGPVVTLNRNFYFRITDKGFEEIDPEASYCIYVDDQSGWGDLALYISGQVITMKTGRDLNLPERRKSMEWFINTFETDGIDESESEADI